MADQFFCEMCDQYHSIDDGGNLEQYLANNPEFDKKEVYKAGYDWDMWLCNDSFIGLMSDLGLNPWPIEGDDELEARLMSLSEHQ